jgi:hypothetical protein
MRTAPKRLTPRFPSGAAGRSLGRRPAEGAAEFADAERRRSFRVRAPTAAPGTRGTAERNGLANSAEAAPTVRKKKENVGVTRMLLCKLTTA